MVFRPIALAHNPPGDDFRGAAKGAQSFIGHLETVPGNATIVKATIALAHELGIKVIAEGVETRKQLELLKGWGCTRIQGFYFAKPLSADEVTHLLRNGGILEPRSESKASTSIGLATSAD